MYQPIDGVSRVTNSEEGSTKDVVVQIGLDWGKKNAKKKKDRFCALFDVIEVKEKTAEDGDDNHYYQFTALLDLVPNTKKAKKSPLARIADEQKEALGGILGADITGLEIAFILDEGKGKKAKKGKKGKDLPEKILDKYPVTVTFTTTEVVGWSEKFNSAGVLDQGATIKNTEDKPFARLHDNDAEEIITAISQQKNPELLKSTLTAAGPSSSSEIVKGKTGTGVGGGSGSSEDEGTKEEKESILTKIIQYPQRRKEDWQKKKQKEITAVIAQLNGEGYKTLPRLLQSSITAVTAQASTDSLGLKNTLYVLQQMKGLADLALQLNELKKEPKRGFFDNWRMGRLQGKFESKVDNLFRETVKLTWPKGFKAAVQFFLGTIVKWVLGSAALGAIFGTFVAPGVGTAAGAVAFGAVGGTIGVIKRGLCGNFGVDQRRDLLQPAINIARQNFSEEEEENKKVNIPERVEVKSPKEVSEKFAKRVVKFGITAEGWKQSVLAAAPTGDVDLPSSSSDDNKTGEETTGLLGAGRKGDSSLTRGVSHFMQRNFI